MISVTALRTAPPAATDPGAAPAPRTGIGVPPCMPRTMVFPGCCASTWSSRSWISAGLRSTICAALARLRSAAVSPRAFSSAASPSCRALTTCVKIFFNSPGNVRSRRDASCSSTPSARIFSPASAFRRAGISARCCRRSSMRVSEITARSASCSSEYTAALKSSAASSACFGIDDLIGGHHAALHGDAVGAEHLLTRDDGARRANVDPLDADERGQAPVHTGLEHASEPPAAEVKAALVLEDGRAEPRSQVRQDGERDERQGREDEKRRSRSMSHRKRCPASSRHAHATGARSPQGLVRAAAVAAGVPRRGMRESNPPVDQDGRSYAGAARLQLTACRRLPPQA